MKRRVIIQACLIADVDEAAEEHYKNNSNDLWELLVNRQDAQIYILPYNQTFHSSDTLTEIPDFSFGDQTPTDDIPF